MEGSDQPSEELEVLRKLNSIVSSISEYCSYSGELKPNVLFYLLKLELLNENSFATFNEIEVIWTKNEGLYGKNQFGEESVVFKNRNTFPSELCDDQITGAGGTEIKNVDGEISEEIIGESLSDPTVCKLEDTDATEVTAPIFVQNEGYEDIVQAAEHCQEHIQEHIQDPNELQFTLAVQDSETYEYIHNEQGIESFEVESPGTIFSSRSEALQSLNAQALSTHSKLANVENLPNVQKVDETEKDILHGEVQEKLTKSQQIVVNDRRLVPTYECPECSKKFSVPHHLKNHLLSHYKIKNHGCNLCNKTFSENCHLTRHMKLSHGIGLEKKYPCKVCRKEFPTVPRLVQHLKIHTGDTPHSCDLCPARFPTATSLLWHRKVHTSATQYPCKVCGWVYKSKGVCLNHIKKYHPEVYENEEKATIKSRPRRKDSVDVTAENKKFSKLLLKLRERNLIKEKVGERKATASKDSQDKSDDGHTSEEESEPEMEEEAIDGITTELTQKEASSQETLDEACKREAVGTEDNITEEDEEQEVSAFVVERGAAGKMELLDDNAPRRSGRKRKVKCLYGEEVAALSLIKQEPQDDMQGETTEVPQARNVEKATDEQLQDLKNKGTKIPKVALNSEAQEEDLKESAESLRKRGQKMAKCGHFSVLWDIHQFCGMCRFKGKGPDLCAVGEESCSVCEGFTIEQQQYHKIRKRAFDKKREIGKTKAHLKSLKKSKRGEADVLIKQEQGELETGAEGYDGNVHDQADLSQGVSSSVRSTPISVPMEADLLPRLEEAQMDVKTYQKELESKYRWYKCLYCEESFLHKTSLVTHMNSVHEHTEEILFPCTECQKVFATLAQLKRHFTTHGIGAVLTPCPECGRTFRDKSNLSKHRLIHLDVKLYTCEFCGKAFSNCGGLTIHRRTHTGIRPYHCRYCEKSFTNAGALRGHERVHTGEKPYVCDICGVCFRDRSHLNRHKKSHVKSDRVRPYRCGLCGKTFSAQVNLSKHLRGHNIKTEPS